MARANTTRITCVAVGLALAVAAAWEFPSLASAADPPLGTAATYAVLATSTITNTGPSAIEGDVGLSPGTAVTGFPPAVVSGGSLHAAGAAAAGAVADARSGYADLAAQAGTGAITADLGGQTLDAGVYDGPTLGLTGQLTLDGQNNPASTFILRSTSTLVTAAASSVTLIHGAQACHVFWQLGSSATLAKGSAFVGTVLANNSVTVQNQASVDGRVFALDGAVTLDFDTISTPTCAASSPGAGGSVSPSPSTSAPSTSAPSTSAPTTSAPSTSAPSTATPSPAVSPMPTVAPAPTTPPPATSPPAASSTGSAPTLSATISPPLAATSSLPAAPSTTKVQPPSLTPAVAPNMSSLGAGTGVGSGNQSVTASAQQVLHGIAVAGVTSPATRGGSGGGSVDGATPVTVSGQKLAYTGADISVLLAFGAFIASVGAALILLARRLG